jgi:hypothetical protein
LSNVAVNSLQVFLGKRCKSSTSHWLTLLCFNFLDIGFQFSKDLFFVQ